MGMGRRLRMNPQHSSPVQAVLRWREGLQGKFCTNYSIMHAMTFNVSCLRQYNSPGVGYLSDRNGLWIAGDKIDDPSSLYPVSITTRITQLNDFPPWGGSLSKQYTRTNKKQIYNRMNGSPSDPPGAHMHKFEPKRITPSIHRLVSDPTGKEAGWETLT
jgi:hypothetical protein